MATKPKVKRMPPVVTVTAEARAQQFEDFYADNNVLFCKYCQHSLDYTRVDTLKDHLQAKKHTKRKDEVLSRGKAAAPKQQTLTSFVKSSDLRKEFTLDFVSMCTTADIPLEKSEKMKPFLKKHCKQGGTLPEASTLRSYHVPTLFQQHFEHLKLLLADQPIAIIADETTDIKDKSILNVVATIRGKCYLIDVVKMEACNHATLSRAVIKAITSVEVTFDKIISFVTDSASYCKKAYKDILGPMFENAVQVLCLCHIMNNVGEVFRLWIGFQHTATLVSMIKSAFHKKANRKTRYLKYLAEYLPENQVKLPPVPVSTRWNSWMETVKYHASRVHVYSGFFQAETNKGVAVENIIELCTHKEIYPAIMLQMHFISENCNVLMSTLTSMEATHDPLACTVYNLLEDMRAYLVEGTRRDSFGTETDRFLSKLSHEDRRQAVRSFQQVYQKALDKLIAHWDIHPAKAYYKAARIFDPRQLPALQHNIDVYNAIPQLRLPSQDLASEFIMYTQYSEQFPDEFNIASFWTGVQQRYPKLAKIALDAIWMPVASVDVERSFSKHKELLDDQRLSLTDEHTREYMMLYFNGDIEGRLT